MLISTFLSIVTIVSRVGLTTADVLLILITWRQIAEGPKPDKKSFMYVVVRDGALHDIFLYQYCPAGQS